jgi:hypothetical protein
VSLNHTSEISNHWIEVLYGTVQYQEVEDIGSRNSPSSQTSSQSGLVNSVHIFLVDQVEWCLGKSAGHHVNNTNFAVRFTVRLRN